MSYQVDKFNGTFLVSVTDGTIDTTTDLRLVGKNYAGYGEVQNENFLHLLENFSNTTPPPRAIVGQLWYDSVNKKIKLYDGTRYKVAGGAEVSATAPNGLTVGDQWWDTTTKQLYSWTGTDFTLIGPVSSSVVGASAVSPSLVFGTSDTDTGPHTILKVITDDKVVGIFSKAEFTLDSNENLIQDFSVVKKGFTLAKSQTGVSSDNYLMWGTASDARNLGGFPSSQYLRKDETDFTAEIFFSDAGFTVGNTNDLRVRVENSDKVVIENRLGNPITFKITVAEVSDEREVAIINSTGIVPGDSNQYSLGSQANKWNNVHSTTLTGNLIGNVTGNSTGLHTGNVLSSTGEILINSSIPQIGYAGASLVGTLVGSVTGSSTTATTASKLGDREPSINVPSPLVESIPVRDVSGNIIATRFIGIANSASKTFIDRTDLISDPTWNNAIESSQYRTARLTATAFSVVARDANADITARIFNGTATAARYADLAEKYLTDREYSPGTVVSVCDHPEHEVEACSRGQRAIGVVSTNPAFMMNKDLEGGTYIALKGRVPCKVSGAIKKGQPLISGNNGTAVLAIPHTNSIFAIALESNSDTGVKIVEVLVL
jgi:hypothetical protein